MLFELGVEPAAKNVQSPTLCATAQIFLESESSAFIVFIKKPFNTGLLIPFLYFRCIYHVFNIAMMCIRNLFLSYMICIASIVREGHLYLWEILTQMLLA